MNKNDSEMVSGLLKRAGWEEASNAVDSDVVLVNTCSVRLHAEDRAIGTISALKKLGKKVIVMGCMVESRGKELLDRFAHVQAAVGPSYEARIPELLTSDERLLLIGDERVDFGGYAYSSRQQKHSVYVTIMKGCDDFCTYCIVPYTRGRVQSRPPESVLEEVRRCAQAGALEVTLLGQNVNDYGKDIEGWDFARLVEEVAKVDGIQRIRFMSPHPANFTKDDILRLTSIDKMAPYYHLPLQSGDDEILRLMNRKYTTAQFEELVQFIRERVPGVAIGTDLIVGFPGETEKHFSNTLEFLKKMRFDVIYMAIYSPRPGTPAAKWSDRFVPDEVMRLRYDEVMKLEEEIAYGINQEYVNTLQSVLIDRIDQENGKFIGRTATNKTVVFDANNAHTVGEFCDVLITEAKSWVLYGKAPN